jgi:RsiW-degrading membrane proteinase PrsW (M82 family)
MIDTIVPILISIGIPAVFLLLIYTLDLYASRTFMLVLLCFAWGAIGGLGLSFAFNTYVAYPLIRELRLDILFLYVAFAPFAEEILKSLSLLYVSRRSEFTYFVDGAIYGFAAGIGFSITENFLYLRQNPGTGIPLALSRGFSTCLMHGAAAALVGVAVGRFRFRRRSGRGLAMVGGWIAAIVLHAIFNTVSQFTADLGVLGAVLAVGIGLGGVGLIAFFIFRGLQEQKQWFAETLDRSTGVTGAEVRAAQDYGSISEVLEPLFEQFPQKAEQIEELILKQAQMGIRRKVQQRVEDPKQQEELKQEIAQRQADMERLRKEIGPYAMIFVRSIFPEGAVDVWANLETVAVQDDPGGQRWQSIYSPVDAAAPRKDPAMGIFGRLDVPDKEKTEESGIEAND